MESSIIYRIKNMSNVDLKFETFILPLLIQQKQGIILIHHLTNLFDDIYNWSVKYPNLRIGKYIGQMDDDEREMVIQEFENKEIHILISTINMYSHGKLSIFKHFLHRQMQNNVAIAVYE